MATPKPHPFGISNSTSLHLPFPPSFPTLPVNSSTSKVSTGKRKPTPASATSEDCYCFKF